jgi:hypothetical protein
MWQSLSLVSLRQTDTFFQANKKNLTNERWRVFNIFSQAYERELQRQSCENLQQRNQKHWKSKNILPTYF